MDGQPISADLPAAATDQPLERLTSLFSAHYDRLYRLARRLVSSTDDALDLVQETFVRVAGSPNSIPAGNAAEEAWLVRVLINIRRDEWRKAEVRNRYRSVAEGAGHESQGRHPETALIARATIWKALDLLPPRRRAIVVMHELDAVSVSEIASLLGINAITVRWHLSAGRRQLGRALEFLMGASE